MGEIKFQIKAVLSVWIIHNHFPLFYHKKFPNTLSHFKFSIFSPILDKELLVYIFFTWCTAKIIKSTKYNFSIQRTQSEWETKKYVENKFFKFNDDSSFSALPHFVFIENLWFIVSQNQILVLFMRFMNEKR
jgi:hypothetical protein